MAFSIQQGNDYDRPHHHILAGVGGEDADGNGGTGNVREGPLVVLAVVPKVSGCISIICTLYILNEIRIDRKSGRLPITPITRAVFAMSVFVLLIGLAWSASNWMVPPDTSTMTMGEDDDDDDDDGYHDGGGFSFWAPTGNMTTCRLQGFLLQLALGPPLYNAAVLWFAQLSIVHNWSNEQIARWVEMPTHICIWIWCLCSATLLLLRDKYHSVGPVCWASDPPRTCAGSHHANDRQHMHLGGGDDDDDDAASSSSSCNIKLYSTVLYCIPLWSALVYTIISCCRINRHVHRKLVSPTSSPQQHKHVTQRADSLVVLYSLAIGITYTPCLIWSLTLWNDHESFALTLLFGLLEPLQGVWNLAIFLMNRRQATRAKLRHLMTNVVCGPLVRCCPYPRCWSSTSTTDPGNDSNDDEKGVCYDNNSDDTKSSTDHRSNLQLPTTPASQQLSSDQQRPEPLALSSFESNSAFALSIQSNA